MPRKNILLLTSARDRAKDIFLAQDSGCEIKILTPLDMSKAGWIFRQDDATKGIFVAGSEAMPSAEIDGVIPRLAVVTENDLAHIVEADRAYLATEMTAFLLAWLSSLSCPMMNRPTPSCLSGPCMSHQHLIHLVARLGVPVVACKTTVKRGLEFGQAQAGAGSRVIITGERHLGQVHPRLARYARMIAQALKVDFVAVDFNGADADARFVGIDFWPEINAELAQLMLTHLAAGVPAACPRENSLCA